MLRESFWEQFAGKEIGGTLCLERDWGNIVLRERLGEHCSERESVGTQC